MVDTHSGPHGENARTRVGEGSRLGLASATIQRMYLSVERYDRYRISFNDIWI